MMDFAVEFHFCLFLDELHHYYFYSVCTPVTSETRTIDFTRFRSHTFYFFGLFLLLLSFFLFPQFFLFSKFCISCIQHVTRI